MATYNQRVEDLVHAVELHHEQYLRSLRSLHDGLTPRARERANSRNTTHEAFTPPLRALSGPIFSSDSSHGLAILPRARRPTLDAPERPDRSSVWPSPRPMPMTGSPHPADGEFPSEDELAFIPLLDPTSSPLRSIGPDTVVCPSASRTLTPLRFEDDMLLRHLKESVFADEVAALLEEIVRGRADIDMAVPFRDFAAFEREGYVSTNFEVYDIDADAAAKKTSLDVEAQGVVKYAGDGPFESPEIVDAPMVWEAIRNVNADGQSVGRITIVQEPTPLILAALHLAMSPHFDMSELLEHLLSDKPNRGRTYAFMHRAFERPPSGLDHPPSPPAGSLDASQPSPQSSFTHTRQRSFFFVFKYYTVVGKDLEPAQWQRYDKRPSDKRLGDHIDIAECSSVLALSLGGEPTKPLWMRPRRERTKEGFLFDTFGAWHLLSIQSFPDDVHTVRGEEFQRKSFYNGPYAFLDLLVAEYRDAGKRNQVLHEQITKLITPPPEFMFDPKLRDRLLFEDKNFTFIRRYFWGYNTLAVINTGIKAMIAAYFDTFTDEFWAGTHPVLWPHPAPESPEGIAYRDKMAVLRKELEKVVNELSEVLKRNERTRKEIENLRDQLFSGSSIKESRRAIDQGDNIRILTMISMIFLPLTFVTSVFGITEFTIPATDWRFAVTMVLVCVPFMLLITMLQTRTFTQVLRKLSSGVAAVAALPRRLVPRSWEPPEVPDGRPIVPQPRGRKARVMAEGGKMTGRWKWPWTKQSVDKAVEEIDLGGKV